jgi:hypothetical protein
MTKAAQKLQVAKENREEIVTTIKGILLEFNTYLDLKGAMEAFLSAQTKDCTDAFMVMINGYQKVRTQAGKMTKKSRTPLFLSEAAQRQLPSSMR